MNLENLKVICKTLRGKIVCFKTQRKKFWPARKTISTEGCVASDEGRHDKKGLFFFFFLVYFYLFIYVVVVINGLK